MVCGRYKITDEFGRILQYFRNKYIIEQDDNNINYRVRKYLSNINLYHVFGYFIRRCI